MLACELLRQRLPFNTATMIFLYSFFYKTCVHHIQRKINVMVCTMRSHSNHNPYWEQQLPASHGLYITRTTHVPFIIY